LGSKATIGQLHDHRNWVQESGRFAQLHGKEGSRKETEDMALKDLGMGGKEREGMTNFFF
jgi:hypothetical protein